MAKYVVIVDGMAAEQTSSIAVAIKDTGVGWWHWIGNVWLIQDSSALGAGFWRNLCLQRVPGGSVLVFEAADNTDWSACLPKPWHQWLYDNWRPGS